MLTCCTVSSAAPRERKVQILPCLLQSELHDGSNHLRDVLQVDGRIEVRDLSVGQLQHGFALARVLEDARFHH